MITEPRRGDTRGDRGRLTGARTAEEPVGLPSRGVLTCDGGLRRHQAEQVNTGGDDIGLGHARDDAAA
jgi:hypothetical protein